MRRSQAKKQGISHPFSYSFGCPRQGIKNATGLCYLWRCPGRWPVCIQLYGQGEQAPIDRLCTHISAFRGLSACQGSLNSSKIVVNEMVLTCLKCPWIQCFQGIIRFWLDFFWKRRRISKKNTACPQVLSNAWPGHFCPGSRHFLKSRKTRRLLRLGLKIGKWKKARKARRNR